MQRHTQHGGQRKGPAHGLAPPRVHVGVVVDQRLVVYNVEDEDALWTRMLQLMRPPPHPASPPTPPHPTYPSPYHADQRGEEGPAPFHPGARSVPDHTGNVVHEAVRSCDRRGGRAELETCLPCHHPPAQPSAMTYHTPRPPPRTPKMPARAGWCHWPSSSQTAGRRTSRPGGQSPVREGWRMATRGHRQTPPPHSHQSPWRDR